MFRNVVWSETAESCLNKTANNDAYGVDTMGQDPFNQFKKAGVLNPSSQKSLRWKIPLSKSLHRKIPPAKSLHRKIPLSKIFLGKMPTSKIPLKLKSQLMNFKWFLLIYLVIIMSHAPLLLQFYIFFPWPFILTNLIIMSAPLLRFWPYWFWSHLISPLNNAKELMSK